MTKEHEIEQGLIAKLSGLKYVPRPDIRNREALELNFRQKFEALNQFLKELGLPLLPGI